MKILHITQYCHAGSIGGTERYILDLIEGLKSAGIDNVIGWLKARGPFDDSEAANIRISALPAPPMRVDAALPEFRRAAERLLEAEKPDVVHFHTFGLTEALMARLAKQRGIPYVFTYHSPAWTCRRETMLLYGEQPCDGEVRAWRCSACHSAERLREQPMAGRAAAAASMMAGWTVLPLGATLLRRRTAFFYDTLRYRSALREFLGRCDLVVSCCDWSTPVLLNNGARPESVRHFPQGVSTDFRSAAENPPPHGEPATKRHFTVGCVGRLNPVKGVHVLMQAFSKMPQPGMRLRIVGWEPEHAGAPYPSLIKKFAEADARITLVSKTTLGETIQEYRQLTLLAVPSIWMETGPLTLLEALAVGVPVYGSNRIGQAKLLHERGRVIEPNTPESWQDALAGAFERHKNGLWGGEVKRAIGTEPVRTMSTVTSEMLQNYQELLSLS
jgi:glycosyltransferase involved in cell wall biosynthesis